MSSQIAIYQLHSKFVNQREGVPEDARQIVYYSLAVGHHVGVIDCFSSIAEVPLQEFCTWLEGLPEGPGRSKLEGVAKWGEIEINHTHASLLLPLLENSAPKTGTWMHLLIQSLRGMLQESAIYVMLRKRS